MNDALVDQIDALLPQTQCGKCDFDGCRPYALAMAAGQAPINQCPPGGESVIVALATLLHQPVVALNTSHGIPGPLQLATIDERHCIGCTLCIQACPVDAIVGAPKQMHDVLTDDCTGCALCLAPCPVNCIGMYPAPYVWDAHHARQARTHVEKRKLRLTLQKEERETLLHETRVPASETELPVGSSRPDDAEMKRQIIHAALERARARRAAVHNDGPEHQ